MGSIVSGDRLQFFINRVRERLWVRPLAVCLLSMTGAFVAKLADTTNLVQIVPVITSESVETLLSIMAASMLVIATFAVASMVSAYASASSAATPRSFTLVIADDVSQNALSTFIGAFIFSIVALTVVKNDYYEEAGLFTLFILTVFVFGVVILTFVRWVDRIARLGRLGATIEQVEKATADSLRRRRDAPAMHGVPVESERIPGSGVFATTVGYVQRVDMESLQACAETAQGRVRVAALPGTFAAPGRALAYLSASSEDDSEMDWDYDQVARSFRIGDQPIFDDDPRFGLVVLSEIAGRALSPAVNDPGTAIGILGSLVRLFVLWEEPASSGDATAPSYDRVEVPEVSVRDMFDDAFTAIARDGAGVVEVSVRLQKALRSLTLTGNAAMEAAAKYHGQVALKRAQMALNLAEDFAVVKDAAELAVSETPEDASGRESRT